MAHATAYRLIPDCRVSLDGKKLEIELDARLTRVDIDLDADLFGQCVLTFNDPKLALINGKDFQSGKAILVEIGFHTKLKKVFEGEVVALEPQFRRDAPPALRVVCQESIHRLALSQMTRAFNDVDDKEIATKIAQEHGLTAEAPAGSKEHILQGNVTDAVFLKRLAAKQGNTLRIEGKKLIIGPPEKGADVQLAPGDGLRKIKVQIKASQQVSEVTVHGWDPKAKQEIVGKAKPEGEIGKGAQEHGKGTLSIAAHEHVPADVATAEAMAKGRLRKIAEGYIQAQGEMVGDPGVIPGAVLNLDKMGDQIDGQYRVDRAVHAFSKHGYFVNFKAVRIGKKKPPPKPQEHTWETDDGSGDDQDGDQIEIGPDGKPVVRPGQDDVPGSTKWHRPRLEHLALIYDEGRYSEQDVEDDWNRRTHHMFKLENLEFGYQKHWRSEEELEKDPDFQDAKTPHLEHLKFGYAENFEPTQAQLDEAKKATHQPRLENLDEGYTPGGGTDEG